MSHFTLTVCLPGTLRTSTEVKEALKAAMEPFDENRETPRYVRATKADLIAEQRADIASYRDGTYAEYLADPAAYAEKVRMIQHLEYLAGGTERLRKAHPERYDVLLKELAAEIEAYGTASQRERLIGGEPRIHEDMPYEQSFPAKLDWDEEQLHASALRWEDEDDITPEGGVHSTRNPNAKWDWYQIGGRWPNYWRILEAPMGDSAVSLPHLTEASWGFTDVLPGDAAHVDAWLNRPGPRSDVARRSEIDWDEAELWPATMALLDSTGAWHQKGEGGWFGTVADAKDQEVWNAEYRALLAAESDNTWCVLVDFHI